MGANISQPLFSSQLVLAIEPGPPKWFANALSARPWTRSIGRKGAEGLPHFIALVV